jgi:hypothetical protein
MQGGSARRNTRQSSEDDQLTPLQRKIVGQFGVSEEAYKKHARSVQMGGPGPKSTQEDW